MATIPKRILDLPANKYIEVPADLDAQGLKDLMMDENNPNSMDFRRKKAKYEVKDSKITLGSFLKCYYDCLAEITTRYVNAGVLKTIEALPGQEMIYHSRVQERLKENGFPTVKVTFKMLKGILAGKTFDIELMDVKSSFCPVGRERVKGVNGIVASNEEQEDIEVSSKHGKFFYKGSKLYYMDIGSSNGSYIDGKELTEYVAYEVKLGDIVEVGQSSIEVFKICNQTA